MTARIHSKRRQFNPWRGELAQQRNKHSKTAYACSTLVCMHFMHRGYAWLGCEGSSHYYCEMPDTSIQRRDSVPLLSIIRYSSSTQGCMPLVNVVPSILGYSPNTFALPSHTGDIYESDTTDVGPPHTNPRSAKRLSFCLVRGWNILCSARSICGSTGDG